MKIAHFSDLHYCQKHLKWADKAFAAAIDHAISSGCEAAVISGDSFDAAVGSHDPAFHAYIERMVMLAGRMPVLVLQGTYSHDRPGSLDVLKLIPTRYPILVADRLEVYMLSCDMVTGDFSWRIIGDGTATHSDEMAFFVLPSLNNADPEIMSLGTREYVCRVMENFATVANILNAQDIPTALVTHGTITGCETESRHAMVSQDHEFDVDTLSACNADAVMIGHIHKHQSFHTSNTVIAYPGSLARLVHGDHDPKGWLIWTVVSGSAIFEFVESPTRRLFEIEFDGPPDLAELSELAQQVGADDAVRIRWVVDEEYASLIDKAAIRAMFSTAESVRIEPTVLPVQSIRAQGISKAASIEDKLAYFLRTTGDEGRIGDISDRLSMLSSETPEGIIDLVCNANTNQRMAA